MIQPLKAFCRRGELSRILDVIGVWALMSLGCSRSILHAGGFFFACSTDAGGRLMLASASSARMQLFSAGILLKEILSRRCERRIGWLRDPNRRLCIDDLSQELITLER